MSVNLSSRCSVASFRPTFSISVRIRAGQLGERRPLVFALERHRLRSSPARQVAWGSVQKFQGVLNRADLDWGRTAFPSKTDRCFPDIGSWNVSFKPSCD